MSLVSCFKAYDIRGRVPDTLNPRLAYAVGCAFVEVTRAQRVVVGRDCRLSGASLSGALVAGLQSAGAEVVSLGLCGTEEVYHAAFSQPFDGGIMVTGSHNPASDNGMKFVRAGAVPISGDSGLNDIRDRVEALLLHNTLPDQFPEYPACSEQSLRTAYIDLLLKLTETDGLRPLRIHADPGNGCAGLVLRDLAPRLPYSFTFANMDPDGNFPNGVPNPLLPERREATARAVRANKADMGIAWDGDFDRCFLYDAEGNFIEGYYIVGLLAQSLLARTSGATIIHDPRLLWNTCDVVRQAGGVAVQSKTGHAFIKERMRAEDALYGGEMSAHHYFRDFAYCDSGMLPWLLVAGLVARTGISLADLVGERQRAFPCSGEINCTVSNADTVIARLHKRYAAAALNIDETDGVSMNFGSWRFNVRCSNTEPLLRLNVEARGDVTLMNDKTAEILAIMETYTG